MPLFTLSKQTHGETVLGFYGSRTALETPGPGAYDAYPFLNPAVHRTTIGRHFPDRSPGFRNVVDRRPGPWRPEPMSLSRIQSEQPLVHYASATFWAWPEQRRRTSSMTRQIASDNTNYVPNSGTGNSAPGTLRSGMFRSAMEADIQSPASEVAMSRFAQTANGGGLARSRSTPSMMRAY
eukprot:TRINITY_DN114479_c0_g1_i1.p1 TRINITY_DN114479_c0_g1~~TRINITY_DN114479_c0_g1_i1.p1  ORF type:complete len:180 (-),score=17.73 TRINITY_DN114479_c0_g1_i1:78-617(-)